MVSGWSNAKGIMSLMWSSVCAALLVCIGKAEELCTNQWEVALEGSNSSELVVHHSSVSAPGRLYHLTWQWRGDDSPPARVWVTLHTQRGLVEGGFSLQPPVLYPAPPARLWWELGGEGEGEGGLRLGGMGDPRPLAAHPPWQVSICDARLVWGIDSDGMVFVVNGDVNVSRSLEEGWTMDLRLKRQAEFPTVTEPPRNGTIISWWRRLLRKFTDSPPDGTTKSLADWAEIIMRIFFTTVRHLAGQRNGDIPTNPDAEMIPSRFQADQTISDDT